MPSLAMSVRPSAVVENRITCVSVTTDLRPKDSFDQYTKFSVPSGSCCGNAARYCESSAVTPAAHATFRSRKLIEPWRIAERPELQHHAALLECGNLTKNSAETSMWTAPATAISLRSAAGSVFDDGLSSGNLRGLASLQTTAGLENAGMVHRERCSPWGGREAEHEWNDREAHDVLAAKGTPSCRPALHRQPLRKSLRPCEEFPTAGSR